MPRYDFDLLLERWKNRSRNPSCKDSGLTEMRDDSDFERV